MVKGHALTLLYTVLAAFIGLCALLYLLQETAALTEKASDQTQSEIQRQVSRRKLRLMEIAGRDLAELQRTLENAKLQVDGKTRTLSDLLPLY